MFNPMFKLREVVKSLVPASEVPEKLIGKYVRIRNTERAEGLVTSVKVETDKIDPAIVRILVKLGSDPVRTYTEQQFFYEEIPAPAEA